VTESFLFDLYYGGKSASESLEDGDVTPVDMVVPSVTEETPAFRNIYVKNLVSRNARRAMFFNGLPEMNITNINVKDTWISSQYGAELSESDGINFKNVTIISTEGAPLLLNNVKNFSLSNLSFPDSMKTAVEITGSGTKNIILPEKLGVNIHDNAPEKEIKLVK